MEKKKRIVEIMIIGFLLIILMLVIILIIQKKYNLEKNTQPTEENSNNRNDNDKDKDKETIREDYTGIVTCIMTVGQNEEYQIYNLDEIDVSEGIVQSRSFFTRIKYAGKDNYEGFKTHEKVNNPIYDDENLTITYLRDEKVDLTEYQRDIQEFSKELEQNGYTCSTES